MRRQMRAWSRSQRCPFVPLCRRVRLSVLPRRLNRADGRPLMERLHPRRVPSPHCSTASAAAHRRLPQRCNRQPFRHKVLRGAPCYKLRGRQVRPLCLKRRRRSHVRWPPALTRRRRPHGTCRTRRHRSRGSLPPALLARCCRPGHGRPSEHRPGAATVEPMMFGQPLLNNVLTFVLVQLQK